MARTFVQPGKVITHANSSGSDISAGDVVVMGVLVGVALVDIADGESGSVSITGVHTLAKTTGTAWAQGDVLDWDASAEEFQVTGTITPASGDVEECAIAAAAAASGDATGEVRLTPNPSATAT